MKTFTPYIICAAIVTIMYFVFNYTTNQQIETVQKHLHQELTMVRAAADTLISSQKEEIAKLKTDNEATKQKAQYWYDQSQLRSRNPDYDYDFNTAAYKIAESTYRPGE